MNMQDILIIDDNSKIISLLSEILVKNGYGVFSTNSFEEGLNMLQKQTFYTVLLDAPMHGFEGLSVLDTLEKENILREQKIILFTGLEISISVIKEWQLKGLYAYLKKPISVEKIIKEISSVPTTKNYELIEKRTTDELLKTKLEGIRTAMSSLKSNIGAIQK